MCTETITIYGYSELSEEAKATAYKAWEPDYAFEADNRRTLEAFCTAFGIEVTEYVTTPTTMCSTGTQTRRSKRSESRRSKRSESRNWTGTSGTAFPSSSRPGFIWTT